MQWVITDSHIYNNVFCVYRFYIIEGLNEHKYNFLIVLFEIWIFTISEVALLY